MKVLGYLVLTITPMHLLEDFLEVFELRMVPGRHHELLGAAVPKGAIVDAAAHGTTSKQRRFPNFRVDWGWHLCGKAV